MGISRGNITTNIIKSGLVFNMDAANRASYPRTGTTATDTVNSINGTISGASFNTTDNGIFNFDGTDDEIVLGNESPYKITNSISLCYWFKSTSSTSGVITKDTSNGYFSGASTKVYSIGTLSNELWMQIGDGTNVSSIHPSFSSYLDGNWHCVVGTWTPIELCKLYVNGSLFSTNSLNNGSDPSSIQNVSNDLRISTSNSYSYNGSLGPIQIYNRALSSTEVLHNYNALKGRFE